MIELPVQKRSASVTNPNRGDDHSTSSSAKRERCSMISDGGRSELDREVAIGNRVERVRAQRLEAELAGDPLAVDRERRSGERRAAERQAVDAPADIRQPLEVPRQHRVVRHQVMAERHRLRDLQVREARHDRVAVLVRQVEQRVAQRQDQLRVNRSIAPRSHSRTSVATWSLRERRRVQSLAGVTDALGEPALDVEVHVLEIERPFEAAGLDVRGDARRGRRSIAARSFWSMIALRGEHSRMRARAGDVDLVPGACRSRPTPCSA